MIFRRRYDAAIISCRFRAYYVYTLFSHAADAMLLLPLIRHAAITRLFATLPCCLMPCHTPLRCHIAYATPLLIFSRLIAPPPAAFFFDDTPRYYAAIRHAITLLLMPDAAAAYDAAVAAAYADMPRCRAIAIIDHYFHAFFRHAIYIYCRLLMLRCFCCYAFATPRYIITIIHYFHDTFH